MRMFFERAALWGSGQGLEQGKEITETRKGGKINPAWVLHGLRAGDEAGFVLERGCGAQPSLMLLAWKMLLWWKGTWRRGFPP